MSKLKRGVKLLNIVSGISKDTKKHRSRTELIAGILEVIGTEGELTTRIMYRANTSQHELKEYLRELLRLRLITYNEDSRKYYITGNGLRFMELYNGLREHLDSLE